ncbi:methyltransferase [Candidatus Micrarchaeota archaeon]|nr:methyltransferase [Candidatus Micrarchaeota archaeon]
MKRVEFDGITLQVPASVYAPREDSFLLAEAVKKFAKGKFLEVGTGSGLSAIVAARKKQVESVAAVDSSASALKAAEKNAAANGVSEKIVLRKSDLFSAVKEKFDCIAFNPPYLPSESTDKTRVPLKRAWEGGASGRVVLDRFLREFVTHLKPTGILLLLNSSVSSSEGGDGNEETRAALEKLGFKVRVVGKQDFFFEHLVVFKAVKQND